MSRATLALPDPPLSLGVNWNALALLVYCRKECDPAGLKHLEDACISLGPEKFMEHFAKQAERLNNRPGARGHVVDPREVL